MLKHMIPIFDSWAFFQQQKKEKIFFIFIHETMCTFISVKGFYKIFLSTKNNNNRASTYF